ncbi:MAG: WYL domain-containing protein [Leucobacter sp.]
MNAVGSRSVPIEQRIFSLVLALVARPEGATRHELLSAVYGYADRYEVGRSNPALERQFERDKDQLRQLGIRVETLDSPLEPGNNQLTRYRISKEVLEFPQELTFTERELELLRLAALAWSEGSMTVQARRAAMKLQAMGAGLDVRQLGVAPVFGSAHSSASPLQRGIDGRRIVEFEYLLPGRDRPHPRRVAPLRLHRAEGRWHLVSWDLERDAPRVFLLSRIRSSVRVSSARFDPAFYDRADDAVSELLRQAERHIASIFTVRGSLADARLAPRAEESKADGARRRHTVRTLDLHALADELAGYGADAVVHEPTELRDLVTARLRAVAEAHGGDDG